MAKKALQVRNDQYELAKTNQDGSEGNDTEYRQQAANLRDCSTSRVWLVLTIFFLLTTLALGGYLLYVHILEKKQQMTFEEKIIMTFPGYFRTPEEQLLFQEQYNQVANTTSVSPVAKTNGSDNCTFSCQSYRYKRSLFGVQVDQPMLEMVKLYSTVHLMSKRAAIQNGGDKMYHSCCISQHKFISPATAEDVDGKNVKILKLNNRAQYFLSEKCEQAQGCTGCRCGQKTTLIQAVVTSPDSGGKSSVSIKLIKLPGCCRCFNGQVS